MATLKCKGLTVVFDITVTMGSTTMNGLTAPAQAVEGQEIVTARIRNTRLKIHRNPTQTNDGAKTLTAAGLAEGDMVICISGTWSKWFLKTTTRRKIKNLFQNAKD